MPFENAIQQQMPFPSRFTIEDGVQRNIDLSPDEKEHHEQTRVADKVERDEMRGAQ